MEGVVMKAFWVDRRTLVTGGSGLLGSWLTRHLAEKGADLVCLVRDWVPRSELVRTSLIEQINVVRGDVRDQGLLERILAEYEIETVFHLAAQTIVGVANGNPISTFETNIQGTWAVLEACRRSRSVKQVIVASSDKAYGDQDVLPYDEETPLQGCHPYDVSKSCADLIAQAYSASFGLPVAITRCGNLFGGGDLNWNRIVPGTIRSVLRGEPPVIRSDGKYARDYFYVEDAAAAYMHLAEQLAAQEELKGQAFNFSGETELTVLELVQRILYLMGSNLEPKVLNIATNEIRNQRLSTNKAHEVLRWQPLFSLDAGLRLTIDWYREFLSDEN